MAPSEGGPSIKPGTKTEYGYVFNSQKRSIFNPVFRNTLPEIMQVFDFADPNMVTGKRTTSSVPTQALYMLNSSFIKENATSASKTIMMSENISTSKIEEAYKIVLGRLPTAKENQIIICESCYEQVKEAFKCENLGSINMKNKSQPLTVYNVIE